MTDKHVLRVTANVNTSDRHWTTWLDAALTTSAAKGAVRDVSQIVRD